MPDDRRWMLTGGLTLIGLGVVFLFAQFIGWDRIWPLFPILGGLAALAGYLLSGFRDSGLVFLGVGAVLVGLFFFGFTLGYWEWSDMARLWPVFVLIGGVGIVRLPDVYTRMHAASLTDTMGTLMILFGIMLQAGLSLAALKLAAIALFLMLTGPTATYALANAAMLSGLRPDNVEMPKDLPEDMQL